MAAGFVQSFCISAFLSFLVVVFAPFCLVFGASESRGHCRSSLCEASDKATKQRIREERQKSSRQQFQGVHDGMQDSRKPSNSSTPVLRKPILPSTFMPVP